MRVKSATDPLELVAAVDDVAAWVDLLEFGLLTTIAAAKKASASTPSDTSNSTLDLKEGCSCGI